MRYVVGQEVLTNSGPLGVKLRCVVRETEKYRDIVQYAVEILPGNVKNSFYRVGRKLHRYEGELEPAPIYSKEDCL